jgi:penicillin-binding protein
MTVSSVSGKLPTDLTTQAGKLVTDLFNRKDIPTEADDALVKMKYISYNGVNYVPLAATPEDMLREAVMVKREMPIDQLIEELKAALGKVSAQSRKSLAYYLPADAGESAPSKTDPRADDGKAPPAPPHVSVEEVSGSLHISFTPVGDADVAGYRLYRSGDGINYERIETSVLTGEDPRFSSAGSPGVAYSFYVTAVDVAGNESPPSEVVVSDGTPAAPDPNLPLPGDVPDPGVPADPGQSQDPGGLSDPGSGQPGSPGSAVLSAPSSPKGLKAQSTDIGLSLAWQDNAASEQVTAYEIWYATTEFGKYKLLGASEANRFEYVAPLASGWYRVTASNEAGESPPSASVQLK